MKVKQHNPLDHRLWIRGDAVRHGIFTQHSKPFPRFGVTAVVTYHPGSCGGSNDGDQKITSVYFVPLTAAPGRYEAGHDNQLTLSSVHPVVICEVLADLTSIASKVI